MFVEQVCLLEIIFRCPAPLDSIYNNSAIIVIHLFFPLIFLSLKSTMKEQKILKFEDVQVEPATRNVSSLLCTLLDTNWMCKFLLTAEQSGRMDALVCMISSFCFLVGTKVLKKHH